MEQTYEEILEEIDNIYEKLYETDDEYDKHIPIELWKKMYIAYISEKPDQGEKLKVLKWMHDKINMYYSWSTSRCKRQEIINNWSSSFNSYNEGKSIEEFVNLFTLEEFRCLGI